MSYVDGFLVPIPKKNVAAYKKMAKVGCKVWMEHGALAYFEGVGDDLNVPMGISLAKVAGCKPSETVVFAYIVYKNKAHRNKVNKAVMKDPRLAKMPEPMPFDVKRMGYAGFKALVEK